MAVDTEFSEISTDSLTRIKYEYLQASQDNCEIADNIIKQLTKYKYLIISEVPEIATARENVLYFAPLLNNLNVKKYSYESGNTTVGLSKFGNNNVSFYANPVCDEVAIDHLYASKQEAMVKAKTIFLPNLWPDEDLKGKFKESVRSVSKILLKVSILVLAKIDCYFMNKSTTTIEYKCLSDMAEASNIHKSRMIHMHNNAGATERTDITYTRQVFWHYDIGICASMVQDHQQITPSNHSSSRNEAHTDDIKSAVYSGLVVMVDDKTRLNVRLQDGEVGFQIGMSGQIFTGGELKAPAHCVQLSEKFEPEGSKLSRSSFLLFVYPPPNTPLEATSDDLNFIEEDCFGVIDSDIPKFKEVWKEGIHFSDFHEARIAHYSSLAKKLYSAKANPNFCSTPSTNNIVSDS